MAKSMMYTDHPGSVSEIHREFEIFAKGGDYFLCLSDERQSVVFRYCISGGFEGTHPKTTAAIAELYRAFVEENKEDHDHATSPTNQ